MNGKDLDGRKLRVNDVGNFTVDRETFPRQGSSRSSERRREEGRVAPLTLTDPRSRLDRPLYCLLTAKDTIGAGRVWQGICVLLFTSPALVAAFADWSGVEARPPVVFSRSRPEFLRQARRSFEKGFIGGLIDPTPGTGQTAFLGFDVDRRQGNPGPPEPASRLRRD